MGSVALAQKKRFCERVQRRFSQVNPTVRLSVHPVKLRLRRADAVNQHSGQHKLPTWASLAKRCTRSTSLIPGPQGRGLFAGARLPGKRQFFISI